MKLIFLHIPKAAGTTFHRILERLYQGSRIFTIRATGLQQRVDEFTSLSDASKEQIDLLKGHMPFGLHSHFKNHEAKYITIFRSPVDRIVSHYEYVLRHPEHYLHGEVKSKNMSLMDYALSDLSDELDNHQCRALLKDENIPLNSFSKQAYDRAVENLGKHFISFGIVEEFDKTLLLFRHDLGWKQIPFYVKLNVKPDGKNKLLSADTINRISSRNQWDVLLYNYVKEEFARRLLAVPRLDEDLQVLQSSCEAYRLGIDRGIVLARQTNKTNAQRIKSFLSRFLAKWPLVAKKNG